MAKLETQINQVYLVRPDSKKTSLVLYEETLHQEQRLFVLLELTDIKKKIEANELKKISEIILSAFRQNQKMPAGTLFESTLAQINTTLSDLAHKGSKSWLTKFSAIIALKSESEILLANSGQASAWIKRRNDFSEILEAEKKGAHPLKTFLNFATGKLKEKDAVILTTTNLFNFVSLELLTKLLSANDLAECVSQVSSILQDSAGSDDSFAAFFLEFSKDAAPPMVPVFVPDEPKHDQDIEIIEPEPAIAQMPPPPAILTPLPAPLPPLEQEPVYAPLPEDLKKEKIKFSLPKLSLPTAIPKLNFKTPNIRLPFNINSERFKKMSLAEKFFLACFVIFVIVLAIRIITWTTNSSAHKDKIKVDEQVDLVEKNLADAESALIYKNEDDAVIKLTAAKEELAKLADVDEGKYAELEKQYLQVSDRINRITKVESPRVVTDIKQNPSFIARAGTSFVFSAKASNTISIYTDTYKQLFMLNSTESDITGLAHIPSSGTWVADSKHLYKINEVQNQFEKQMDFATASVVGLKYLDPNRIYVADKANNQVWKIILSAGGKVGNPTPVLKSAANLSDVRDFGLDADVYLLYPNMVKRFVSGNEKAFKLDTLTDPMTDATKIFVGSSLYILEPAKRRLLIFDKSGNLLNQIFFPNSSALTDFYVDETSRKIDLINGNSLIEMTF